MTGGGSSTLSFNPTQDFTPGEQVSVTIPAALLTSSGQAVRKQVYQFTAATGGTGQGNFASVHTVGLGDWPQQVLLADVDGDDDLDLVTGNATPGGTGAAVRIRLNDGSGAFSGTQEVAVGLSAQALALADLDADSDLDLLIGTSNGLLLRLNDGTGTFSGTTNLSPGLAVLSIVVGDVDADGDLDLLTGHATSLRQWLNTGNASFTNQATPMTPGPAPALVLADVDADGDLDLVCSSLQSSAPRGAGFVSVRLNDGQGLFTGTLDLSVGNEPRHLVMGDVDADGDLDFVVGNTTDLTVNVGINNGRGDFTLAHARPMANVLGLALGDVDADGDLDLVATGGYPSVNAVRYNNGAGSFNSYLAYPISGNVSGTGLALGDVDADGDLDMVTGLAGSSSVAGYALLRRNELFMGPAITTMQRPAGPVGSPVILLGTNFAGTRDVRFNGTVASYTVNSLTQITAIVPTGAGTGPVSVTTSAGTTTSSSPFTVTTPVAVTSLTPNRHALAIPPGANVETTLAEPITAASALNLRVFGSQRQGARAGRLSGGGSSTLLFEPAQDFAPGEQISVSVPASLQSSSGGQVRPRVQRFTAAVAGPGRGTFVRSGVVLTGSFPQRLTAGDVDGDGDMDLVTANHNSAVTVQFNSGAGVFNTPPWQNLPGAPKDASLADMDGDGDLDLLSVYCRCTNGGLDSRLHVYQNDGSGQFTPTYSQPIRANVTAVATGDVDGDGDLDAAVVITNQDSVNVYLNGGSGQFGAVLRVAVGGHPEQLALGDMDNDGDLDLVTLHPANTALGSISVRLNNGLGDFLPTSQTASTPVYSSGSNPVCNVEMADVNGDGNLDVVFSNNVSGVFVLLNDGQARLSATPTIGMGAPAQLSSIVLGDVDADGDLDLACVDINTSGVHLRFNDGTGSFSGNTFFPAGYSPASAALADFDGDGDLDLAVTGQLLPGDGLVLYLNERAAIPSQISFTPGSGTAGTSVELTGQDFSGATAVSFNGTPATTFTVLSATRIRVTVPVGASTGLVSVTTPVGTGTSAAPFIVTVLSARSGQATAPLLLFPNPARQRVTLRLPAGLVPQPHQAVVSLRNSLGQSVQQTRLTVAPAGNEALLDLSQLTAGLYTLHVELRDKLLVCKLLVQ